MKDNRPAHLLALLAVALLCLGCDGPSVPSLEYEIVKSRVDTLPALEVRVRFAPDSGTVSYLSYEDEAWGETGLFGSVREVKLLQGQGTAQAEPDSSRIRIAHGPGSGPLTLSYKIIQDFQGTADAGRSYRPIVQPEYFHVFAHNLLAVPGHYRMGDQARARISLQWNGWDQGEVIHNSFGSRQRRQQLGEMDLDAFMSAVFVGGDFRVHTESLEGNQLHLAIRGDWVPFEEADIMELLTETVLAQRNFWRDHSQEYFTVTMRPFPQEQGSSFQGTGLTNSFATAVSNNEFTDLDQLLYLFNHELMHNWIGHAIENADEEAQYWFSEGFTEYYTSKNIAVSGIADKGWEYFIDNLNEAIRLLEASPVRDVPNSEINYENFWTNAEYSKLPYRRGMLFAFYLDLQIQAVNAGKRSLDHVMRDLLQAAGQGQSLTHELFISTVNAYLPEDITPFFNQHIVEGKPLPLKDLFRQLGYDYAEEADLFDLGFELGPGKDSITGVDTASEAFRAGVRAGDRVVSRSIYLGNTRKEVELVLEREGLRIPVAFLPVKRAEVVQLLKSEANQERLRG